jgi:hypothetical protein
MMTPKATSAIKPMETIRTLSTFTSPLAFVSIVGVSVAPYATLRNVTGGDYLGSAGTP